MYKHEVFDTDGVFGRGYSVRTILLAAKAPELLSVKEQHQSGSKSTKVARLRCL